MTFLASSALMHLDCIMTFLNASGLREHLREDLGEKCLNQRRSNYFCKIRRRFCSFVTLLVPEDSFVYFHCEILFPEIDVQSVPTRDDINNYPGGDACQL